MDETGPDTEILIVGAGPTGLVLALWLTQQGIAVRIIDCTAGPGTTSRALTVQARTLELYRQLDLADAVIAAGRRNPAINFWVRGRRRASITLGSAAERFTPYPYVLVYPQDRHERLLEQRLAEMGVSVERNSELVGFTEESGAVVASMRGSDGLLRTCHASYLAGCDGARSPVRHQLDVDFVGGTYDQFFYVADIEATGAAADGDLHIALESSDFVILMAYDDRGHGRLIGAVRNARAGAETALTFADIGKRAIAGLGLEITSANWFSTYRVHHRVADKYRVGRVFLLGDAAHVHSPAGGQGMNTGIGDAINLAWKLAAVLRGKAPDNLLDTYETERRAFAKTLVATTDRLFTIVTGEGWVASFIRTQIAPLLVPLVFRVAAMRRLMVRVLSQTMISYRHSPLSAGRTGSTRGGDRLPFVRTTTGDNFARADRIGWQVHVYGVARPDLRSWAADHAVPIITFPYHPEYRAAGLVENAAYVLRPDTYLGLIEPNADPLVLERYFADRGLNPSP